jgi:hypothetical protein
MRRPIRSSTASAPQLGPGVSGSCTCNHHVYEILLPPYLLNANGTTRPVIQTTAEAGHAIRVTMVTDDYSHTLPWSRRRRGDAFCAQQRPKPRSAGRDDEPDQRQYLFSLPILNNTNIRAGFLLFWFAMNANGRPQRRCYHSHWLKGRRKLLDNIKQFKKCIVTYCFCGASSHRIIFLVGIVLGRDCFHPAPSGLLAHSPSHGFVPSR